MRPDASNVLRFLQHSESVSDQDPVLSAKLGDIGNRRECDEVEHSPDESVVPAELPGERQ